MDTLNEVINKTVETCEAKDKIMCIEVYPGTYVPTKCLWIIKTMHRLFQGNTLEEALEHLASEEVT